MADLTFTSYEVEDASVRLTFLNPDPGPGRASKYTIAVSDAELASATTGAQLRTLVTTKLQRKLQAANIASKLDGFIGQTVTI